MPPVDRKAPEYWRSLHQLADTPEFRELLHREFPAGAAELLDSGKRDFLKLMGASLALAGVGLAGCRRWPRETIVPFAHRPPGRDPGSFEHFATAMERGGAAAGLLVSSFDGRPIKIEGNPEHPINRGATDAWAQASVLELYDPDRSRHVMRKKDDARQRSDFPEFDDWAKTHFGSLANARGDGLHVLCESTESPSVMDMKARLLKKYPRAAWHEYEPINNDGELEGSVQAFGEAHRAHYAFDKAQVIVSLDSDFLLTHPAAVKYTRDFAQTRRAENAGKTISRLYVFESGYSLTGANADNRFPVRSADVAAVAGRLAARIVPDAVPAEGAAAQHFHAADAAALGIDGAALDRIAVDLEASQGRSIVMAGSRQPAAVHVLAHLINERLGNLGTTVTYSKQPDARPHVAAIRELCRQMAAGQVGTLVILGGDPVYNAPIDLEFGRHLQDSVRTSIHLSLYDNKTSTACTWHLPRAHYLESWGDARSWDGTLSVVQPLIMPLFGGRSRIEVLAAMSDDELTAGYDIVRRTLGDVTRVRNFEPMWRKTLHDGFLAGSAYPHEKPKVQRGALAPAVTALWSQWAPAAAGTVELVFAPDASAYDGRYANSGWLQEMPDPLTKLTWDNAVLIGPAASATLGIDTGDMVRLTLGDRMVEAAACVMPGQHSGSVTLALGYGQGFGSICDGAGFDFYLLRTAGAMSRAQGAAIERIGGSYVLAQTQDHHAIDSIGGQGTEERLPTILREATIGEFRESPDFARHRSHVVSRLSLFEEDKLHGAEYRWAMSIDLTACTGCTACVIACQAENNIPVVGKDQVKRGREMHWIRVDRYFKGTDPDRPQAAMQPVPCMMCENAPCEQVCPVAATTHDKDGLNVMIYNRCIGTRYCSNNCPYKVRRFNYFDYQTRDPVRTGGMLAVKAEYYTRPQSDTEKLKRMQFNPEVTVRSRGVMEKCTYCVQRISQAKIEAKNKWVKMTPQQKKAHPRVTVPHDSLTTACAQACPAQAIVFGDLNDPASPINTQRANPRSYEMLGELNVKTRTRYLAALRNPAPGIGPAPKQPQPSHGEASHG